MQHCCFVIGAVRGPDGGSEGYAVEKAFGPVGEHECLNGGFVVCFPEGFRERHRARKGGSSDFQAGFQLANEFIASGGMTLRIAVNFDVAELLVHRTGDKVGQASQYPWMRRSVVRHLSSRHCPWQCVSF